MSLEGIFRSILQSRNTKFSNPAIRNYQVNPVIRKHQVLNPAIKNSNFKPCNQEDNQQKKWEEPYY